MSTRSAIIIKIKDSDLGKVMKFDPTKIPTKVESWDWREIGVNNDESSKEFSEDVKIEKPYIGIYCNYDGYLDGVGQVLKEKYNDYDTILNAILGGYCSSIQFDSFKHYANREGNKWEWIKPTQGDTPFEVEEKIDNQFVYLFENGEWKYMLGKEFVAYDENGFV